MVWVSDEERDFRSHYLNGGCGKLALGLSHHLGLRIVSLHAMDDDHADHGTSGDDFIHAYVILPDGRVLDAFGARDEAAVRADYHAVLMAQKHPDISTVWERRVYADAKEFIARAGLDPAGSASALQHARIVWHWLGDVTLSVLQLEAMADAVHQSAPILMQKGLEDPALDMFDLIN